MTERERHGATWLASYPKSGNTWLRLLLEAYRRNGDLDINDVRISSSDGGATIVQGVSPMPLSALDWRTEILLRPAALLNMMTRLSDPVYIKTHFCNLQLDDLPPTIPVPFTKRAVYVVRDPRAVLPSFSRFYKFPLATACDAMASNEFCIGGNEIFARCLLSSWSNHVASWAKEDRFPVHVVRYEDLQADTSGELVQILEFLDIPVDAERVEKAVAASDIRKLKKAEADSGFREHSGGASFFGAGSAWREELGEKWIRRIENDHGLVMETLGYEKVFPADVAAGSVSPIRISA